METPEKAEQVTIGKVVTRKKPLGKRFTETFLGGDAKSVMHYIVQEVVLPAVKDAVVDAGSQFIERMIFGENRSARSRAASRWGTVGTYTNYQAMSQPSRSAANFQTVNNPQRTISRQAKASHNFSEIILSSRAEAEMVLDKLQDRVNKYEQATVNDLYDLVGITGDFTDEKYGWTDLTSANVRRLRSDQYLLDLPSPIQLD